MSSRRPDCPVQPENEKTMRSFGRFLTMLVISVVPCACSDSTTEPEAAPIVELVAATAPSAVPAGLTTVCMRGPDTLESSPTCPVIRWLGRTYWAYSHADNRLAMTLVAYDQAGNVVKQLEKQGARYVWQITVNNSARTVTIAGQASNSISMTWEELR